MKIVSNPFYFKFKKGNKQKKRGVYFMSMKSCPIFTVYAPVGKENGTFKDAPRRGHIDIL